jgi:hypothetical protein
MDDEELAKLMREIDQFGGGSPASTPASEVQAPADTGKEVATTGGGGKGRWVGIAAVTSGVGGFLVGSVLWFIPWVDPASTGLGAALGGAIAALVGKPPKWLQ